MWGYITNARKQRKEKKGWDVSSKNLTLSSDKFTWVVEQFRIKTALTKLNNNNKASVGNINRGRKKSSAYKYIIYS